MSIYLGTLGRMVELKCPAMQQVNTADGFSFEETLEGRVKAQPRPIQRRTWSLGTSDATTPSEHAAVQSFINGAWGPGPFIFVSADAPVTNLLTPTAAASMENFGVTNILYTGPVNLGALGWEGRSISLDDPAGTGAVFGVDAIPLPPDGVVTGSAYVKGAAASVRLYWYDSEGAFLSFNGIADVDTAGQFVRLSITRTAPAGAASVRLVANGINTATRPAITWGATLYDWAAGEGCPKAVIHAMSKSLVMASRDSRGGRFANLSYTITEVG